MSQNNNPVLMGAYADPDLRYFNGKFYLYPTTDGTEDWLGTHFEAFSSDDLIHWRPEGEILRLGRDVKWAEQRAWAPAAAEKNGRFYFYFSANANIGVAVADSPTGPFRDGLGKPLVVPGDITRHGRGQAIDPYVFQDDDGRNYLYAGNGQLVVAELNDDMMSFREPFRCITPPGFREAMCVVKRRGRYHFTWSDDDTRSEDYHVNYGYADNPYGPVIPVGRILEKRPEAGILATGHHSILQLPEKDEWVIAYHRFRIPDGNGFNREVCIDKLEFDDKNQIKKVIPSL